MLLTAQVRYRTGRDSGTVQLLDDGLLHVSFDKPERAVTPQQLLVLYSGDICLGGGPILAPGISRWEQQQQQQQHRSDAPLLYAA
jgi:tRNA U34 2-thiouridine synthase MnmA/TrmU